MSFIKKIWVCHKSKISCKKHNQLYFVTLVLASNCYWEDNANSNWLIVFRKCFYWLIFKASFRDILFLWTFDPLLINSSRIFLLELWFSPAPDVGAEESNFLKVDVKTHWGVNLEILRKECSWYFLMIFSSEQGIL